MPRPLRFFSASVALALAVLMPNGAQAQATQGHGARVVRLSHHLPAGSPSTRVFSFGIKGGSLRPWSVAFALDGSVTASGITTTITSLSTPQDTLKGLLALAEAEGFFSLSKQIGCSGGAGPDASAHFIAISTSTGARRVSVFGTCKATFNQLYAVLQQVAGTTP